MAATPALMGQWEAEVGAADNSVLRWPCCQCWPPGLCWETEQARVDPIFPFMPHFMQKNACGTSLCILTG